jgi:hypothetical protein
MGKTSSTKLRFIQAPRGETSGFDAIVGNPPFLGGSKIPGTFGHAYLAWLLSQHEDSHGNSDLAAHFFRRAFSLLRREGALELIATNTIGQGDTRTTNEAGYNPAFLLVFATGRLRSQAAFGAANVYTMDFVLAECKLHPQFKIGQAITSLYSKKQSGRKLPNIPMCGA